MRGNPNLRLEGQNPLRGEGLGRLLADALLPRGDPLYDVQIGALVH